MAPALQNLAMGSEYSFATTTSPTAYAAHQASEDGEVRPRQFYQRVQERRANFIYGAIAFLVGACLLILLGTAVFQKQSDSLPTIDAGPTLVGAASASLNDSDASNDALLDREVWGHRIGEREIATGIPVDNESTFTCTSW